MTNPRDLTKAVVDERPRRIFGFCAYCGRPCIGVACRAHRDLVTAEQQLYTESNEPSRATSTAARPGSSSKGA